MDEDIVDRHGAVMNDDIKEEYQKLRKSIRENLIAKVIDPYGGYVEDEPDGWQPIETCDNPYQFMVLCHKNKKWIRLGRKHQGIPDWYYSGTNERSQYAQIAGDEPTHWMPMMELPE
jgi:hypothetical protein